MLLQHRTVSAETYTAFVRVHNKHMQVVSPKEEYSGKTTVNVAQVKKGGHVTGIDRLHTYDDPVGKVTTSQTSPISRVTQIDILV